MTTETVSFARTARISASRSPHEPVLGLIPRLLIFFMPLVAATNPVLPVVGPVSPFPALAACLFVVGMIHIRPGRRFGAVRGTTWLFGPPLLVICVFTLGTEFGAAWEHNESVAVTAGVLVVLAMCMIRITPAVLRLLLNGWLLAFCVTGALAAVEVFTGQRVGESYLDINPLVSDFGIVSVFYNPNNYAAFISFSYPLLFGGRALAPDPRLRRLYTVALIGGVPLMLLTNSRFGIAALLLFIIIWAVMRWRSLASRITVVVAGVTTAVATFAIADSAIAGYWGNTQYSIPFIGIEVPVDASIYARWNLGLNGMDALATNPLLGAGPGGFEIHAQNTGQVRQTFGIIKPHNGLVELLSQYGAVIFALGVVVALVMLRVSQLGLRNNAHGTPDRSLAFSLFSGVFVLPLVVLMNSSYLEILHLWGAFAVFVAIACFLNAPDDASALSGISPNANGVSR